MFDRYMLVDGTLENWAEHGKVMGFQLDAHYPHHCGIWLSIIEEIVLAVDGVQISTENMTLILDGKAYPVAGLTKEKTDRWYFGQAGKLRVSWPGGLEKGTHMLKLRMALRVSFLSWFLTGEDTKSMLLKEA